jgi:outer membrane immunogenic protein
MQQTFAATSHNNCRGIHVKKIILAATALISATALTTAAQAADFVPAPAAYDWSGFYFGLNAGAAWNNSELDNDIEGPAQPWLDQLSDSLDGDDAVFTGGAMLGYNWQMDSIVLGVEADINYLGFSADSDNEYIDFLGGVDAYHDLSFEADWFGTLRGRLGFAADNFLFYGTGGLAYGHLEAESDFRVVDGGTVYRWEGSADDVNWGWTIGAGMEYGIDNWSIGVEYLYVDLGEADWDADFDGPAGGLGDTLDDYSSEGNVDYQFSVVRATAKIRF